MVPRTVFALTAQEVEVTLEVIQGDGNKKAVLQEILVVRGFPNVFSEDLLGLPPDKDVKFTIELQPRIQPISKAPYRMVRLELLELSKQL